MHTQDEWAKIWGRWVDKNATRLKHYIVEDGASDDAWHERIAALYDRLYLWIREHRDINMLTFRTLDEAFDALVEMGLEKNPTELTEKEKQAQAEATAQRHTDDLDSECFAFYVQHSSRECEEMAKRNPTFRKWLESVKRESLKMPEAPASQTHLFTVRTVNNGVIRYLASDGLEHGAPVLTRSRENAFPLGSARANYFAEFLKKQGHITVDILPLNEPARSPELSDTSLDKYAGNFHREIFERELAERKRA